MTDMVAYGLGTRSIFVEPPSQLIERKGPLQLNWQQHVRERVFACSYLVTRKQTAPVTVFMNKRRLSTEISNGP